MTFLLSPIARYAAAAVAVLLVVGWAMAERAGRQVARLELAAAVREAAGMRETIRTLGVRRDAEDAAAADPDPMHSLRDRWSRP